MDTRRLIFGLAAAMLLCGARALAQAAPQADVANGAATLTLSALDQQHDGILTAHPAPPPSPPEIAAYGTVLDAAGLTALSNRYLDASAKLATAEANLAVSRAAGERAKILHGERQISTAELQQTEGHFAVDRATLGAARAQLETITATARQSWGSVLGDAVVAGAPLVRKLIDRSEYLVKVTLPPGVDPKAPPAAATARSSAAGEARLAYVSPATSTDPQLQGLAYFYTAPAASGLLPGMNLAVALPAGGDAEGLLVPQSAVVWLAGKAWVFLRTGKDTFTRRQIRPDRAGADGGYVVTSLPADAEIVVQGAQMLLSEEFRSQVRVED